MARVALIKEGEVTSGDPRRPLGPVALLHPYWVYAARVPTHTRQRMRHTRRHAREQQAAQEAAIVAAISRTARALSLSRSCRVASYLGAGSSGTDTLIRSAPSTCTNL
eukprot:scaffold22435_cov120-Isochrysis_galbana.AAC.3